MRLPDRIALAVVVLAFACVSFALPVRSATPPAALNWTALSYEAENALGRVGGEIALSPPPERRSTWVADVRTWFRPLLFWTKASTMRVWFDPRDGSVERLTKLTSGPRPDKKIYRFTESGAHRVRIEPDGSEGQLDPDRWTHVQVRESFHDFRPAEHGCEVVSDPAAILVRLSSSEALAQGREERVCVLSGKTFYRVDLQPKGWERVRVDYRLTTGEGVETRSGKTVTRRVKVRAHPVAGELDEEDLKLEIFVDEASGLPVQIRTPIAGFGSMEISLVKVSL